ncbi:MAG: MerR family transcriptional regulator [Bacteroidales bacterium]
MEKLLYTIGEVAEILGESTSLVRFWSNTFSRYIKPQRNAKGNRQFTADDVEVFKQIHVLVKREGLSLEGAAKKLSASKHLVSSKVKVIDSLKEIRSQLEDVRLSLSGKK